MKARLEQVLYELLEHFDLASPRASLEVVMNNEQEIETVYVTPEMQETIDKAIEVLDCDEREWDEDD